MSEKERRWRRRSDDEYGLDGLASAVAYDSDNIERRRRAIGLR